MPAQGQGSNSISVMKNEIITGRFHSPSRFHVEVSGPAGELSIDQYIVDAIVPSRTVVTQEEFLWGIPRQIPVARSYAKDAIITYAVKDNQSVRRYFEQWMNTMFNKILAVGENSPFAPFEGLVAAFNNQPDTTNNYSDYTGEVKIKSLDYNGEVTGCTTLIEAYPSSLLPINYSAASQNDFTRLQVQFGYKEYVYG